MVSSWEKEARGQVAVFPVADHLARCCRPFHPAPEPACRDLQFLDPARRRNRAVQLGFRPVVLVFVVDRQIDAGRLEGQHQGGRVRQIEFATVAPGHPPFREELHPFGRGTARRKGAVADAKGKPGHGVRPHTA
ncbi:hypothetical protein RNZ50_18650 [Paracoccaceae bacterium Fryx2]|nr:hypothetical protein [Paracoccaceae bacterium Fryx2]